jgi:hypothetical protein
MKTSVLLTIVLTLILLCASCVLEPCDDVCKKERLEWREKEYILITKSLDACIARGGVPQKSEWSGKWYCSFPK